MHRRIGSLRVLWVISVIALFHPKTRDSMFVEFEPRYTLCFSDGALWALEVRVLSDLLIHIDCDTCHHVAGVFCTNGLKQ